MKPAHPHTPDPGRAACALRPERAGECASRVLSFGVALVVSASFLVTAREGPLPALSGAAAFLFLFAAVEQDVRRKRIPNALTFPFLLLALVLGALGGGAGGLLAALAGAGAALGLFAVPFLLRWMGAGDVKALMVLGALFGTDLLLPAAWWMLVSGGLLAIALVAVRGELLDLLGRWLRSAWLTLASGRLFYVPPAPRSAGARGIPFAVAIGLGATAQQLWGLPWL